MKVLMFGWEFPPHTSGGLGVACQGLANALADKNIDLIFVLPKKLPVGAVGFRIVFGDNEKLSLREINSLLSAYITSSEYEARLPGMPTNFYGMGLFEEACRYGVIARRLASQEKFDVIHAHDWLSFSAGIEAKRVSRKPLIAHIHATEFDRGGGSVDSRVYEMEKAGFQAADKIIAISDYIKNTLVSRYGIDPAKIEVVHNGIDPSQYEMVGDEDLGFAKLKQAGYKMVLFVGRLTVQKGPDYFIRAAKKVLGKFRRVFFVIAGSGDMQGQMMELVASLGISDKVVFAGFLRGKALSQVYKEADLFVMPSISEPFGLTPLESLLHGTPAIISKQSGVSEVLHHVMKVDFWDVDEMADKILSVLEYKSLERTMANNGMKEVAMCTWDKAADRCIDIYKSLTINYLPMQAG